MINEEDLTGALKRLASRIKEQVEYSVSRGTVQPNEEVYFKWKIDKFQYTEQGVTERSSHGDYITKKSWIRAYSEIKNAVKKSGEYASTLELLTQFSENVTDYDLERFIVKMISDYLYEPDFTEKNVDTRIASFLKDIKGEPLKYGAEVELDGVVLVPNRIEFWVGDMKIVLRQTQIVDLEKEYPVYGFTMQQRFSTPSAILDVEFLGRHANEIQDKVLQAVAILRLFKVGSVEHISYRMHSESVRDMIASGTASSITPPKSLEKSLIKEEDVQKLKSFWETMIRSMPSSFYDLRETKIDHVDIAYKRYCDALLQNGLMERRIANAVMGLESLFLKGGETQELLYRLCIRIAKILSLMGHEPYKVRELLKASYRVRSLFVHGAHLEYKEKRTLNSKYGDVRSFLQSLLDYLRICIIIMIFVSKGKEELLDLIDDALVDKVKDSQLDSLLNTARAVISG